MQAQLRNAIYNTSVYDWSLRGSVPERLRGIPPEPLSAVLSGNSNAGREILNGNYNLLGHAHHLGDLPWRNTRLSEQQIRILHRFEFLADLKSFGTDDAADKGRELMTRWINDFGRWRVDAWRPEVTGGRLVNWLRTFDFLHNKDHPGFEMTFLESCAVQIRHLSRSIEDTPPDQQAVEAAEGLILGAICLNGMETVLENGLAALEIALERQILADGGHFQRNPTVQYQVLLRLVRIRDTLSAAQLDVPHTLQVTIDRMVPMLRAYRHTDGRLALFNGSTEGNDEAINQLLKKSGTKARSLSNAPHTGFQRAETKHSALITDAGAAVVSGANLGAHAGLLSFEFSHKNHRLIVNCGASADRDDNWHTALRATAAHSTVCVNDTNALEVRESGELGVIDTHVTSRRSESDGSTFLQMRHDGYRKLFGLVHARDIYISAAGDDLRGCDTLKLMMDYMGSHAKDFAVRFHLHPEISAELSGNKKSAILKVSNREGWRFRCSGGDLSIEESVYLGIQHRKRRTSQLVISGLVNQQDVEVKWSLIKEG
ncbi:MAG: hypothetical protein HON65_08870 [Rhodospirillales bacterium]|nr:hypothetical protein [Rhodospirillales bacterium]